MCDPVSIGMATLGLGVASSVGTYMSANASAKATTENAKVAFDNTQKTLSVREMQEQDQTAAKVGQMQREYDGANAQAINKASDAGLQGLTISGLVNDLTGQEADRVATSRDNLQNNLDQTQLMKKGAGIEEVNRINSSPPGSAASLALGIAGSAVSAGSAYMGASRGNNQTALLQQLLTRGA